MDTTPTGKAPAREGAEINSVAGEKIGVVTSGGFGPSVGGPIAMGYVAKEFSEVGQEVHLIVRGKPLPAKVTALPFFRQNYFRG